MKLDLISLLAIVAATLTLLLGALDVTATPPYRPAFIETDGPAISAFKRKARNMIRAVSDMRNTHDVNAEIIARIIPYRDRAINQANNASQNGDRLRMLQMRQIAEQIAAGQTKELAAMKK